MLSMISYITWDPSPEIFSIGSFSLRYYGLSYLLAFFGGYYAASFLVKKIKMPEEFFYRGFFALLLGVVIGGRLGHVFFYDWGYYSQNWGEILMFWKGGMASHGATIGIIISFIVYAKLTCQPFLQPLDIGGVVACLGGFFVRLGNLMNSEIVGKVTDVPWAFRFVDAHGVADPFLPRHPAQLYEAIVYLILFFILFYLYMRTNAPQRLGLISGLCVVGIFTSRFFIEFFKENQIPAEDTMAYNLGQYLSIPMVMFGIFLIIYAMKRPPKENVIPEFIWNKKRPAKSDL